MDDIEKTAGIVLAYVSHNNVSRFDLSELIIDVHAALKRLTTGERAEAKPIPAVPVRKSVTPDYIISLEDGKKFKSLKRHLSSHHDMTPDEYRTKWGLPADYPMVAPNYARSRSELAKQMGLGKMRKRATTKKVTGAR
jgi:predicted transcriptional regulator